MPGTKSHHTNEPAARKVRQGPRKIVVDFPEPLFRETESAVAELATTRSDLIRIAVETFLRDRRAKQLQEELIAGYTANARSARKTAEELSLFD